LQFETRPRHPLPFHTIRALRNPAEEGPGSKIEPRARPRRGRCRAPHRQRRPSPRPRLRSSLRGDGISGAGSQGHPTEPVARRGFERKSDGQDRLGPPSASVASATPEAPPDARLEQRVVRRARRGRFGSFSDRCVGVGRQIEIAPEARTSRESALSARVSTAPGSPASHRSGIAPLRPAGAAVFESEKRAQRRQRGRLGLGEHAQPFGDGVPQRAGEGRPRSSLPRIHSRSSSASQGGTLAI
jgi:hypothetical protein